MNLDHRFIAFPFYNRTYVTIITPPLFLWSLARISFFPNSQAWNTARKFVFPDIVADMKNRKNIKLNVLNLYRVLRKRRYRPTTLPLRVEELEPFPISDVTLSVRFLRVKRCNSFDSFRRSYPFVSRGELFHAPGLYRYRCKYRRYFQSDCRIHAVAVYLRFDWEVNYTWHFPKNQYHVCHTVFNGARVATENMKLIG